MLLLFSIIIHVVHAPYIVPGVVAAIVLAMMLFFRDEFYAVGDSGTRWRAARVFAGLLIVDVAIGLTYMLLARGLKTSYLRLRALPTTEEYRRFVAQHPRIYVVESNFDGQMTKILQTETPERASAIQAIAHCDGLPFTSNFVAQAILESYSSVPVFDPRDQRWTTAETR